MMAAKLPPVKSPFITPKPVQQPANLQKAPAPQINSAGRPSDPFLEKYPYLREANKARPAVYHSPYAPGSGFTAAWKPNPDAPLPNASKPLSQDFLLQRSPSQQEKVTSHMRRQSETTEQIQRDRNRSQQEQLQDIPQPRSQHPQPQSQVYSSMPAFTSPKYTTTQPSQRPNYTPQYQPYSTSYSPPVSTNPYAYDLSHRPYANPYDVMHNSPPPHTTAQSHRPSYGLQYQSPQDFQMQMQRESQSGTGGFDHFFKGLQNAAAAGHQRVNSSGGSGPGQGSPIKSEMGNGGEMLPMMRERY